MSRRLAQSGVPRRLMPRQGKIWTIPWRTALAALLIIFLLYGASKLPRPKLGRRRPAPVALAAPRGDRKLTQDLCLLVDIDESGSMASSDPRKLRATSTKAAANWLGRYGRPGDDLGVIWFADRLKTMPPTPVVGNQEVIEAGVKEPSNYLGNGNDFELALTTSADLLNRCSGKRPVLAWITDGIPNGGPQADKTGITQAIRHLPAGTRMHMVAMNVDRQYERGVSSYWEDPRLGLASVHRIDRLDRAAVAAALAGILSQETGQRIRVTG